MKQKNQLRTRYSNSMKRVSMSHFDPFQVKISSTGRGMIGCRQHPALIMAEFRWFSHLLGQTSAPGRWRYVGTGDPSSTGSRCRWWGALKRRMFHPRIPLDRWTFHKRCLSKNYQEWSDGKFWSLNWKSYPGFLWISRWSPCRMNVGARLHCCVQWKTPLPTTISHRKAERLVI